MTLPDTSLLAFVGGGAWRRLGERLRSQGLTAAYVRSVEEDAAGWPEPARSRWTRHLHRRAGHPASIAIRLFVFHERLEEPAVRSLLGPELLEACLAGGVLAALPGGLASPYRLDIVNGLFVFADHESAGADAVMPVGESTQLLARASFPQLDVSDALDLGCGSGVLALLLAGAARRVVAADVNPRAAALARFNAELNAVDNVEVLEGDLWDPLAGRRFDLVVSQPPFHPRPPEEAAVRFLHGGPRGDELTRAVVARLSGHLAPGGRAFVLSDFPWDEGLPLASSLRPVLRDPEANLLVLRLEPLSDAEAEQARLASIREPEDEAFASLLGRLRSHLATLGIRRVQQAIVAVARAGPEAGWTREVVVPAGAWRGLRRSDLDDLLARGGPGSGLPAGAGGV